MILRNSLSYGIFIILMLLTVVGFFPKARIYTNDELYNPNHCNYYFSLQSLLANYPLLAKDKANLRLIRSRLLQFEKELSVNSLIVNQYRRQYDNVLKAFNISSVGIMEDEASILAFASQSSKVVDSFYLDHRLFCINPMYDWSLYTPRRILRYNLSGLYAGIPNKYAFILSAIADDWLTGTSPGLFTINQSTVLDTRYMTSLPLITALYVLPKYDFVDVSKPGSAAPWNYFRADSFIDPLARKILDVSGIDFFTIYQKDLQDKKIPGSKLWDTHLNQVFDYGLLTFQNLQSYGLAYLAEQIHYENAAIINGYEESIKKYFKQGKTSYEFTEITNSLYQKLLTLQNKHDIILEATPARDTLNVKSSASGTVNIKGIVGEKAFFETHCLKNQCTLVFNAAKAKGWHAYVNGEKKKIYRVNFAFMAVQVPKGHSFVWFVYEPWSRSIGDLVSLVSLILLIFACMTNAMRHSS